MNTPIEIHNVTNVKVHVKRDDLINPFPSSNNAKYRGIYQELKTLQSKGIKKVGVLDTELSRAGWTVAATAKEFDIKVFTFTPRNQPNEFFKSMNCAHGAEVIEQVGARMSIRYCRAKKHMAEIGGVMLADKLRLLNAVIEVSNVVIDEENKDLFTGSLITSVGSGTIIAGVMRGLRLSGLCPQVYGIMATNQVTEKSRMRYIREFEPYYWDGNFHLITGDYKYKELATNVETPFPCDLVYDRKAWAWLLKNIKDLPQPILFWNVGGEFDPQTGLDGGKLRGDGIVTQKDIDKFLGE